MILGWRPDQRYSSRGPLHCLQETASVELILGHRLLRWPYNRSTLGQPLLFSGTLLRKCPIEWCSRAVSCHSCVYQSRLSGVDWYTHLLCLLAGAISQNLSNCSLITTEPVTHAPEDIFCACRTGQQCPMYGFILLCKCKRQYLLTCKVIKFCFSPVHSRKVWYQIWRLTSRRYPPGHRTGSCTCMCNLHTPGSLCSCPETILGLGDYLTHCQRVLQGPYLHLGEGKHMRVRWFA